MFPAIFYLDEDTTLRMTELLAVLNPYIAEQIALFTMGRRSLDEFDTFMDEINTMGIQDLNQIYRDIYASFLAS